MINYSTTQKIQMAAEVIKMNELNRLARRKWKSPVTIVILLIAIVCCCLLANA